MKGDFTRFTHDPEKRYTGVLQQQGRVGVDADWNEYVQIQDYLRLTGTRDVIGHCGVPHSTKNGFLISRDNPSLVLKYGDDKPARIYVDGIICELENDVILPNPGGSGIFLAYLDVWQRHITAVEDSEIAEVALGGPDTATRIKTEWQVRLKKISENTNEEAIDFKRFCCGDYAWSPEEYISTGRMAAQAEQPDVEEGLCEVEARGGYRGLENRLYRVEIHDGGELGTDSVTFKWSRDNGSVVFPIQKIEYKGGKSSITLRQTGRDDVLTLHVGDWVEVSDDRDELNLKTGVLAQVAQGSDISQGLVVLEMDVSGYQILNHPKIRRWDQKDTSEVSLTGGTIKIKADTWTPLEDGVEVCFKPGTYQVGDYWLIPARTRLRDVLWGVVDNKSVYETRHGTEHYYCALAVANFNQRVWGEPRDLRRIFPSLNELKKTCCIPVHPGEKIQPIIDCVISSGGGCICLCNGVHHVHGPLKLDKARNLTIRGENSATVVHFKGTNEDDEGGFVFNGCLDVTINDMLIVGDNLPSLFVIKGSTESKPNLNIKLENLSMFNRTITKKNETGSKCAIRLGHAGDISIESCRMIAENGIISLFGDSLPDPGLLGTSEAVKNFRLSSNIERTTATKTTLTELNYGIGVHKLSMKDSTILFQNYGIWALKSIEWSLESCRITVLPEMKDMWLGGLASKISYQDVLNFMGNARFGKLTQAAGTAIKALIWQDCNIKGCVLSGATGINISLWLGGEAANNNIKARRGQITLWLHDAVWRGNTIEGNLLGMALSGSYRSHIEGNQVRGKIGLANVSLAEWLGELGAYLDEIVRAYNVAAEGTEDAGRAYALMALWMLLEEACKGLRLTGTRDAVQELLDTFKNYKGIPVLLLASIYLYPRLSRIIKLSQKIPMPLIALGVKDNQIEARSGIRFIDFMPVGGINISDNRVQTLTGQAIEVKANPYTVNPYVVIVGWRFLYKMLPPILQKLIAAMSTKGLIKNLSDERKAAVIKIFTYLEKIYTALNNIIEPILEADYRIENNSIRSRYTAVETNLFELAIQNNHVTMEESEYSNKEGKDIVNILDKYDTTKNLAINMRQRSKARMQSYLNETNKSSSSKKAQHDLTGVSSEIKESITNVDLKNEATNLYQAAKDADVAKINETLGKIVEILESYIDTCGIWIKGAGCRVVGNQVVVPLDADSKTWAQGGIRFWDDEGSPIWLLVFLEELLQLYKPDMEIPSLVAATETLIDNNEVLRGIGHGIEINGISGMPYGMGLVDLKIRGNQIQNMAGAGIAFDGKSLTIGADIEGNRILDCGSSSVIESLVDEKGGLVIRNTAGCRIHNNRIRCSSNLEKSSGLFAVDLQKIYGLTMTDNHLQHAEVSSYQFETATKNIKLLMSKASLITLALANLCGVIRLSEMHGETAIHNNDIMLSRGIGAGLVLGSIDTGDKEGFWHMTMKYAASKSKFIGLTEGITVEPSITTTGKISLITTASVQGNHFETSVARQFFAFLIAGLQELNFSGNNVRTKAATRSPGYIINIIRGAVSNNMLDTVAISMDAGVISGNVSNRAIAIPQGVTAGLNNPP